MYRVATQSAPTPQGGRPRADNAMYYLSTQHRGHISLSNTPLLQITDRCPHRWCRGLCTCPGCPGTACQSRSPRVCSTPTRQTWHQRQNYADTRGSNLHLESPKPPPLLTPTLPPPLIGPRPDPEEEETILLTAKLLWSMLSTSLPRRSSCSPPPPPPSWRRVCSV